MDRLGALRVFRQIAELGSFAGAGRRLGLSPAAVSKIIARLEDQVGARLINRTTRRVALTEEGRVYLAHALRVIEAVEEADQALSPHRAGPVGTLRVSAPATVTLTMLSSAIPAFLTRHPDLTLELELDDRRIDIIRDGFDLAIRASVGLEDSALIARRLTAMPHVLCGAPDYFDRHGLPVTPADLAALDHVRFSLSAYGSTWVFSRGPESERVAVNARYSVSSSLAVRDALRGGFGVSLIPRPYVESDLAAGRLTAALQDWTTPDATLYAIYPSRQNLAPKVRVFLDFLAERFGEAPAG